MAESVEQRREERAEARRLEKELTDQQDREGLLIDLINSGVNWLAVPGYTQSGHATPEQIAKRLAEAVSSSEIRHGAEIVAKFMRARLDAEYPGEGLNRRKVVLSVIEHACSGDQATVAEFLADAHKEWERGTFWRDFSDAWIAIHVCRKFDSYDEIAECRDFDEVRRLAMRGVQEVVIGSDIGLMQQPPALDADGECTGKPAPCTGQVDGVVSMLSQAATGQSDENCGSGEQQDGNETLGDELPKKLRKLAPSRLKAKAAHDWAMSEIQNAEAMTIAELFDAIMHHPSNACESLPDNAEAFGRYLRDAGVRRYSRRQDKQDRTSADEI